MISIIISSANRQLLKNVSSNIENTIGVDFEILSFDNSKGAQGICEIYNIGAQRAKYNILCYLHEDIEIKTQDWGKEIARIFNQGPQIGVLGIAGSSYKSDVPSGWVALSTELNLISCNYIQSFKRANQPSVHYELNPGQVDLAEVVCVDGMWFCTTKTIAIENPFDEELLKGFHCYDIDYCLQVGQNYKIVVAFNILMEHFSEGGYNREWLKDTLKIHTKWGSSLPRSVVAVSTTNRELIEKRAYKWLLEKLIEMKYSLAFIISFLGKTRNEGKLSLSKYFKFVFYAIKFYFKAQ